MTKTDLAKRVVTVIVALGTSRIISGIINNNAAPQTNIEQITVRAAGYVVGAMAADAMKKYTDAKIDEIVSWCEKEKTKKEKTIES
jgi:heme O synthase-like polyprenyltransferase